MTVTGTMGFAASNFNLKNSQWEPLVEPWSLQLDMKRILADDYTEIIVSSGKQMEVNVTHDFVETLMYISSQWDKQKGVGVGGERR